MTEVARELFGLEELVMRDGTAPGMLERHIAEGFFEIGRTGRTYDRAQILELLARPHPDRFDIDEFKARELAPGVMLVTFRTVRHAEAGPIGTLRSSVWQEQGGVWRILFHQGTPEAT